MDVVGIGNAIVDVIATADDGFLDAQSMIKGAMTLVDQPRAHAIYEAMGAAVISSGGSAANTIAGIASFGGRTGFIGKVRDDDLGHAFRHDITAAGARFSTPSAVDGPSTATCLILVTPDSQRTMNTFLGACVGLGADDLDAPMIASASITYLEGYLFDEPSAQNAFFEAARIAHGAGRKVALSLSDGFCVARHRDAFLELISGHVDLLFANEGEIKELYESDDLNAGFARLRAHVPLAAVTLGAQGSVIVTESGTIDVAPEPVARVVDTTGAGDLYAAGFLFGLTQGESLERCGRLGSIAAGEVISHFGARPQTALRTLAGA